MRKLRVMLSPSLPCRLGFLAIQVPRPLLPLFMAMWKGTNPGAQKASPDHRGAKVTRLLPCPARPGMSLITGLEKKPTSYRDHGSDKV